MKIYRHIVLPLVFIFFITGCASNPARNANPIERMKFPEYQYADLPTTGESIVTGQVFLKTRGGDVKVGAGSKVIIFPATTYSNETFHFEYKQGRTMSPVDPRAHKYSHSTIADADGKFKITNLPSGKYYIMSEVTWEVPSRSGLRKTGGMIMQFFTIDDNSTKNLIVTKKK